jgi:hypothetical protein
MNGTGKAIFALVVTLLTPINRQISDGIAS